MATIPFLAIGPSAVMSIIGLIRGPDRTVPTPAENWTKATVDVVIPALNAAKTIVLCLASVYQQTLRPRQIILVDDGSKDRTLEIAKAFCDIHNINLVAIRRKSAIGKTPTIKRRSREFDADVLFVLDSDTVLESENYIQRTVKELYQAVGIASACGTVLPLRDKDYDFFADTSWVQKFLSQAPKNVIPPSRSFFSQIEQAIVNIYRGVLYLFIQKFLYVGQMTFFGTISNPVGCAVAYRRKYLKNLFDHYEPIFGDDLTNSEDIFIGFALLNEGYRNIQLTDVTCRSQEPKIRRFPRQVYLWSSSFMQSCYYFSSLVASPFKVFKRWWHLCQTKRKYGHIIKEKRKIQEPYRQAFGRNHTEHYGRPGGWTIFLSLVEKIFFSVALIVLIVLGEWGVLASTIVGEIILFTMVLFVIAPKEERWDYLGNGIIIQPVRYVAVILDFITMIRFALDLWIRKDRSWRK